MVRAAGTFKTKRTYHEKIQLDSVGYAEERRKKMLRDEVFRKLGFQWEQRDFPYLKRSVPEALKWFHRNRARFVWEAGQLERNPFSYTEVLTLLGGVTVGGHKLSDED